MIIEKIQKERKETMEGLDERKVYLQWHLDIIVADHDGYCSGGENDEELSEGTIWCAYVLNVDEIKFLKSMDGNVNLFNNDDYITDLVPFIPNDDVGVVGGGSGYCASSIHGLYHERQRTPIKVIDMMFERPNTDELIMVDSMPLKRFLRRIQDNIQI